MVGIWITGDYFQTKKIYNLKDNYFLFQMPQGNFSDYNVNCVLGKKIFGKQIYILKDRKLLVEVMQDELKVFDDVGDNKIIVKYRDKKFELEK